MVCGFNMPIKGLDDIQNMTYVSDIIWRGLTDI